MTQIALAIGLAGVSFLLAVIWGPPFLRILTHFNIGETIRVEGPERHFSKLGTPTMGGIMIIIPVTLMTLLMNAATLLGFTVTGLATTRCSAGIFHLRDDR
jgi:phospho-N-acetylmuramoyl-pentapeptide-transferase